MSIDSVWSLDDGWHALLEDIWQEFWDHTGPPHEVTKDPFANWA